MASMGIYLFDGTVGDLVTVHVASTDRAMNPSINIVGPNQQSAGHSDNAPFCTLISVSAS